MRLLSRDGLRMTEVMPIASLNPHNGLQISGVVSVFLPVPAQVEEYTTIKVSPTPYHSQYNLQTPHPNDVEQKNAEIEVRLRAFTTIICKSGQSIGDAEKGLLYAYVWCFPSTRGRDPGDNRYLQLKLSEEVPSQQSKGDAVYTDNPEGFYAGMHVSADDHLLFKMECCDGEIIQQTDCRGRALEEKELRENFDVHLIRRNVPTLPVFIR